MKLSVVELISEVKGKSAYVSDIEVYDIGDCWKRIMRMSDIFHLGTCSVMSHIIPVL